MIGSGAAADVWEGENTLIGRKVAIKVLHPTFADSHVHTRFLAEARAAARINHKNIVDVFDLGTALDGTPFIVMELLSGDTLDAIIARGAVSPAYASELMTQVLSALDSAHHRGIVHRDLKPGNIMVVHPRPDRPVVKVLDFGIASGVFGEGNAPDERGMLFGTLEYMSPEQASGGLVDPRSDLYAAGTILYELLTGRRPFIGNTMEDLIVQILYHQPPAPRTLVPSMPEPLEALILSALAKDAEDRPGSARAFLRGLLPFCKSDERGSFAPASHASEKPIPLAVRRDTEGDDRVTPLKKPRLQLILDPSIPPPPVEEKK
jgi:eukaryotic-like serine/threonine-protein kinase